MKTQRIIYTASTLVALSVISSVHAQPQYMAPTGATSCTQCHLDNFGSGFQPGVLAATASPLGFFPGLKAFLNPTPAAGDTKPVIHPINPQWDVTVGDAALAIPLRISDAEDDSIVIKGSAPLGAKVSTPVTDAQSNLPIAYLNWKPTAAQAGKSYTISLTANETGTGRTLVSDAVTATVNVWSARSVANKNVSQLLLERAQWVNNQLILEGKVLFANNVTSPQRSNLLNSLLLNVSSKAGKSVISPAAISADSTGNWKKTIAITSSSQVPCVVKISYEGLITARNVKLAPSASCVQ